MDFEITPPPQQKKKRKTKAKVFSFWNMWMMPAEGKAWGDEGGQKYGAEHQGKEGEWWRGCEDEKGKLRRRLSDGAQRSERSREDESEKGKTAGKICSNESSCMQIYELFWVSLYINQSGWGDSTKVTPLRLCVFICVWIEALLFSLDLQLVCSPKQTDVYLEQKQVACSEETSTGPPLFQKKGLDHPGLASQSSSLMWNRHMCGAWVQSRRKQSPNTALLPPVRHHYSLSLE